MFAVIPIRSGLPYDPWSDIDDSGKIDMKDIGNVAARFMTSGDSAKNVTIAGHANKLAYSIENQPVPSGVIFSTPNIPVDGYSKMTVCIYASTNINEYDLTAQHTGGSRDFQVDTVINFTNYLVKTYDVPNQEIIIIYFNNDVVLQSIALDVYLIA
jgi:hypothetical protein